ncbi:hypothetical protein HaLaN_25651, partial [Haematococcus lacustris]
MSSEHEQRTPLLTLPPCPQQVSSKGLLNASASNVPASHHPFRRCPNPHSSSRSTQVSGSVVREAAAKLPCPARHPRSPGSIRPPGSSGAPGEHRLLRTALQAVAEKAGSASSIE